MNIYSCWYDGIYGYSCRTRQNRWMFVPELGQLDKHIYKNLSLDDLVFRNSFEKTYERQLEKDRKKNRFSNLIKSAFSHNPKPMTVGGLLFSAN